MSSPEVLDFAKLLAPIGPDKPTGANLRADTSPKSPYQAILEARRAARAVERRHAMNEDEPGGNPPDWRPVLQDATRALTEKTKDLEITAYLIEALVRQQGFAGLRDGFRLAREFSERFWDGLYPLPDEEGITTRLAALTGLNGEDAEGTLLVPITRVPITEKTSVGQLTCAHYQDAVALAKVTDPKERERKVSQGVVTLDVFQKAVGETNPTFFANLVQDLTQCSEEFAKLCAVLEKRGDGRAPPSSSIRGALVQALDTIKAVARDKLKVAEVKDQPPAKGAPAPGPGSPPVDPTAIHTREDAFKHLLKVADFFRRTEPHTPLSYALEQVVRWGHMSLPELLAELIPDEAPRKSLFKQVGIRPPEPSKEAKK